MEKIQQIPEYRLSSLVCKHVRHVLEEDTKDEDSGRPASSSVRQSVTAAATIAPDVSQQLFGRCMEHAQRAASKHKQ